MAAAASTFIIIFVQFYLSEKYIDKFHFMGYWNESQFIHILNRQASIQTIPHTLHENE